MKQRLFYFFYKFGTTNHIQLTQKPAFAFFTADLRRYENIKI